MTLSSQLARRPLLDPSYRFEPEWVLTLGPAVAELNADAGYVPDPEQEIVLNALFAIHPGATSLQTMRSIVFVLTLIAARQTIKTGLAKMAVLGWLYVTEQKLIVWSSHEMDTTAKAHLDLAELIAGCPALSKRLAPGPAHGIKYGNRPSIALRTGPEVDFKARTKVGGRGLTGHKIVLDEAFALKASHMGALLPTLNAIPDPQILLPSSAGQLDSAVLRGFRDTGRARNVPEQAYFEWCADEESCALDDCPHVFAEVQGKDCALDRERLWKQSIPTYGTRTNRSKVLNFRRNMPWDEFAREFLVWWDDPTSSGPFPKGMWASRSALTETEKAIAADPLQTLELVESQISGDVSVAIDVAPGRKSGALAVAGVRADKKTQVELVDEDAVGIGWLVARAAAVVKAHGAPGVFLDPGSPAGSLKPDLEAAGVDVFDVAGLQVAQACGRFYDMVVADAMVHLGQGRLDLAVGGAQMKNAGDASRWDRRQGADISPLMAVTFAAWAASGAGNSFNIW